MSPLIADLRRWPSGDAEASRLLRHLLLSSDRATRTLLRARIRVRPLATHRQATPVPNTPIRADVHQTLDVHRHFGAQRTLDLVVALDHLTQLVDVRVGEIANAQRGVDSCLAQNVDGVTTADAIDVRETDLDLLLTREIDARNTSHDQPCRCLCLGFRLQMMRVTPLRFTTLQCSQIGFTLVRTFTGAPAVDE